MLNAALSSSMLLTAAHAAANVLYVSSYSGKVTTLDLNSARSPSCRAADNVPVLKAVSSTDGCAVSPSWLTLDHAHSTLFCIDEALPSDKGSLSSFKTNSNGSLTTLNKAVTLGGPVSGALYGPNGSALAVAHYGAGALTTWDVSNPSNLTLVQSELYHMDKPGPIADRQNAPHPHQTLLDPTGKFILVPDLGADKIYVYAVAANSLRLTALPPIVVKAGSGPRHVAFAVRDGKTFMYLATELANTIIGYEVTYPDGGIEFKELFNIDSHGAGKPVSEAVYAAEILVSPDAKFLIVSSRGDNTFSIPNFDRKNSTNITSDPLINFSIDGETGSLTPIQEAPCGGRYPRQFSINKAGTLVAVGQQKDARVVLIKRDPESGKLGDFVGYADVAGEITSVIFNE
ncbi:putative 6-phosphogluconolactonase [Metarhizium anisopliae]|nr:putative 6-phosphogluconolactonase [Metarhizium anisopliae]